MVIESFSNPKYKYLLSLSKSKVRKADNVFLMEGRPELDLAFKSGRIPKMVAYCDYYIEFPDIEKLVDLSGSQIIKLSKPLFDALSYQNVPGNFLSLFDSFSFELSDLNPDKTFIVLENVEKPGNVGAVLRTCDALGIENLIITESPIDLFNPNILRNSRGAVFNTKCVFTTNQELLDFLHSINAKCLCAVLSDKSTDYAQVPKNQREALVFGSEANGLSDFWLRNADEHIIIPMRGVVDSLNVSVSVAIIASSRV